VHAAETHDRDKYSGLKFDAWVKVNGKKEGLNCPRVVPSQIVNDYLTLINIF